MPRSWFANLRSKATQTEQDGCAFNGPVTHFVTFHINSPASAQNIQFSANTKDECYSDFVNTMFASVRLHFPNANLAIISDSTTDLTAVDKSVRRIIADIDHNFMMLECARIQMEYVRDLKENEFAFFIDTDILINGALEPVFRSNFDVALTVRRSANMPINSGVVIASGQTPGAAYRFFEQYVSTMRGQFLEESKWFGNQLALAKVAPHNNKTAETIQFINTDYGRILLLPCSTFNFSPAADALIDEPLLGKQILHFKGARKPLMLKYWKQHIENSK